MSRKHGRDVVASEPEQQQHQEEEDTDADAFTLLGRTVTDLPLPALHTVLRVAPCAWPARGERSPRLTWPRSLVALCCSHKVRKEWSGQGVFTGCVVRYKHDLFLVRYEDEDEEELTRDELLEYLVTEEAGQPVEGTQQQQEREPDLSTSPPAAKRRKGGPQPKPCPLNLNDVPMNLPPIPSDTPGSASRFKGVCKNGKKWQATIRIPSEGGKVSLGTFDSEEEAAIMYARARCKYPDARFQ